MRDSTHQCILMEGPQDAEPARPLAVDRSRVGDGNFGAVG